MLYQTTHLNNLLAQAAVKHLTSGGFDGPLYGALVALFKTAVTPSPDVTWADLTEADFSGYAKSAALAWSGPLLESDGSYSDISDLKNFVATTATPFVSNAVYGVAIVDTSTPPKLLLFVPFASPVAITAPDQGIALAVRWNSGVGAELSDVIQIV